MKYVAAAVCIFIALTSLYLRTLFEAARYLERGKEAIAAGQILEGQEHLGEALAWHSPFNSSARDAQLLLEGRAFVVSTSDDQAGEKRSALEELKRGLMSSRSFMNWFEGSARQAKIEKINGELARVHGADVLPAVRELHQSPVSPRLQLLVQLFFWGWLGGVLYMIWSGFTPQGGYNPRELRRGGATFCICYPLWLYALWIA